MARNYARGKFTLWRPRKSECYEITAHRAALASKGWTVSDNMT